MARKRTSSLHQHSTFGPWSVLVKISSCVLSKLAAWVHLFLVLDCGCDVPERLKLSLSHGLWPITVSQINPLSLFFFLFFFVFTHYIQWNVPVLSWFLLRYFITAVEMKPDCWEIILSPGFWGFTLWSFEPVCLGWELVVEEAFHLLKTRSRETEEKPDQFLKDTF